MRKWKFVFLAFCINFFLLLLLAPGASSQAQGTATHEGLQCGANLQIPSPPSEGCTIEESDTNVSGQIDQIISTIINILSLIVGVVAVIMIIVAGLRYVTSSGDTTKVSGARSTILYAIVGLVVVALAQIAVQFVVREATLEDSSATID